VSGGEPGWVCISVTDYRERGGRRTVFAGTCKKGIGWLWEVLN